MLWGQFMKKWLKNMRVTSNFKDGVAVGSRLTGFLNKPQVRIAIEEILGDVLPKEPMKRVDCDVLILGAGSAGLSAALRGESSGSDHCAGHQRGGWSGRVDLHN